MLHAAIILSIASLLSAFPFGSMRAEAKGEASLATAPSLTESESLRKQYALCGITSMTPTLEGAQTLKLRPVERPENAIKGPQFVISLLDAQESVLKEVSGEGELKSDRSARVTTYVYSINDEGRIRRSDKNGRLILEQGEGGWFTHKPRGGEKLDIEFAGCTWHR